MAADAILNINLSSSVITLGSHLRKFSLRPIFSESSIKLITTSANITIECSLTRNTVVGYLSTFSLIKNPRWLPKSKYDKIDIESTSFAKTFQFTNEMHVY